VLWNDNEFCSPKRVFIWRQIAQYLILAFSSSAAKSKSFSKLRFWFSTLCRPFFPSQRVSSELAGPQEAAQELEETEARG